LKRVAEAKRSRNKECARKGNDKQIERQERVDMTGKGNERQGV
jgi:hypothetical protein